MLDKFRKASETWFVKILLGLLVLSFGAWGIGDVVRQHAESTPAITVGNQEIAPAEVVDEFRRDVDRMAGMFGGKLTLEQARQFGLLQRTVEQIVDRTLLDQDAEELGIGIDDQTLRRNIAAMPAFQNELHVFDKAIYQRALARAGFSEKQFIALERHDLSRHLLVEAIGGGIIAPTALAEPLFRYRNERRIAEMVTFPADRTPVPAKPDDSVLESYRQGHASQFMAPESRALTALLVRTVDVASDIKPSEQDVEKSYQVRLAEFQAPDKRNVQQILLSDKAKAQAVAEAVRKGTDFAVAAKDSGQPVIDLGWVERKDLPLPELAEAVFGLTAPGVVGPVESPLGWHVLRVVSVVAGQTRPLAEVRSQIIQDLIKNEATTRLYALSTKLEDAIGAGASLEEAASSLGLKPLKFASIDDRGDGPDGKPPAELPLAPDFLSAAFQTPPGASSEVTAFKDGSGYFVLRVDKVTPPTLRPLAEIKDQVLAAWTEEKREAVARQQADAAAEQVRNGGSLAAVAGSLKVETTPPFLRTDSKDVSPLVAAETFKLKEPGAVAVVAVAGGSALVRLKAVVPADLSAQKGAFDKNRQQLGEALSGDLVQEYIGTLQKEFGVRINNALIDQQFQK